MATRSIGKLHAEITANASQFVSEFNRADNAARRSSAAIRQSVEKTVKDVQRDFSLPKLSKGFLAGLGIGGGMQLVSTGVEKFVELLQSGAEYAKEISGHIEEMRTSLRALHDTRFQTFLGGLDPEKQMQPLGMELSHTAQLKALAEDTKSQAEKDMQLAREGLVAGGVFNPFTGKMTEDPFGGRFEQGTASNQILVKAQAQQEKAMKDIETLQTKIGDLSAAIVKGIESASKKVGKEIDAQWNLRVQEINLGAGRSAAEVRGAITGDETQAGYDAVLKMRDERVGNAKDHLGRLERDSRIRVDDMTRRGLGTGADYKGVQEKTNGLLAEIRDIIRRLEGKSLAALMGE